MGIGYVGEEVKLGRHEEDELSTPGRREKGVKLDCNIIPGWSARTTNH